ncbi:hypothetical protein ACFL27_17220 [candidate division CSSED10-310 bacterium]|uniref:Protein kinase domain-containing protein n=1 Tax=candidate division CSSED10-310 bacterium TaxID=2855610 RepID=A0ABV6Z0G7_UNCC1
MLNKPSTIDQYQIEERLGQGGMGVVYRARHKQSRERVALKTVRVPHPGLIQGIRREIYTLLRIRHRGIIKILYSGNSKENSRSKELPSQSKHTRSLM